MCCFHLGRSLLLVGAAICTLAPPLPLGCQFGNGAPAWHVIMVELEGKLRTEYKAEPITVEGKFQVKPYNGPDGKSWSVYSLQGMKVE